MSAKTFLAEVKNRSIRWEELVQLACFHLNCSEQDARHTLFEAWMNGELELVDRHKLH